MTVLDASALVAAVADVGGVGALARAEITAAGRVDVPFLSDVEVTAALRALVARSRLADQAAIGALTDYLALPLHRHEHAPLLARVWALRENVTAYDAVYVALAEALGRPLVTADGRLARASGLRCTVRLLRP